MKRGLAKGLTILATSDVNTKDKAIIAIVCLAGIIMMGMGG